MGLTLDEAIQILMANQDLLHMFLKLYRAEDPTEIAELHRRISDNMKDIALTRLAAYMHNRSDRIEVRDASIRAQGGIA